MVDVLRGEQEVNGKEAEQQAVSYAAEVVTFGRPHHCALGEAQDFRTIAFSPLTFSLSGLSANAALMGCAWC
jgi:hypothetical protein